MSVMKTSLTIIPMCPQERFPSYKSFSKLVLCYEKDWATLLHLIYFHCLLPVTNYLITKLSVTIISVLAENTLLKTAYHFLPLLVGFDTLTYQKDLQLIPYTCGSSRLFSGAIVGEWSALGKEKLLLRAEIYCHLLLWRTILWGVCSGYLHLDRNQN